MSTKVGLAATCALALGLLQTTTAAAIGGVVGTGAPASCTEASFNAVFDQAQATGGGSISFNCGAAAHAIIFTGYKGVSTATSIDGGDRVTLSGGNAAGLFQVFTTGALTLAKITLTRGVATNGAVENFGKLTVIDSRITTSVAAVDGGAITNHGDAALQNVVVSGNSAAGYGGGIFSDGGTMSIAGSEISDNVGAKGGGGLYVTPGASVTMTSTKLRSNKNTAPNSYGGGIRSAGTLSVGDSTFAQNSSTAYGGAVAVQGGTAAFSRSVFAFNAALGGGGASVTAGKLTLDKTNIVGNGVVVLDFKTFNYQTVAVSGGGILNDLTGNVVMTDVAVIGNRAGSGGGIANFLGTMSLTNVTASGNSAMQGGALYVVDGAVTLINVSILDNVPDGTGALARTGGTLAVKNTVLANPNTPNCKSPITGASFSLSSDASCGFGTGRDSVPMQFDTFGLNGGFTFTQMPSPDSPVIDNGTGIGCPATDQRGVPRPSGLACDVGAVEVVAGAPLVSSAFEYFNAGFGHYFVTALPEEVIKLDVGFFEGWSRTGQQFNIYRQGGTGRVGVCRFFTIAFPPSSSHFYAARGFGCEATQANPDWQYEGEVFYMPLPAVNGTCPMGHVPVYRLYNDGQGGAPNHRFTTSLATRTEMLARGFIAEGAGIGVGMCSPQ